MELDIEQSLLYSRSTDVEAAYIIHLKDHPESQRLLNKCIQSCVQVGMPYKVWHAFDGTSGKIKVPEQVKGQNYLKWLKLVNNRLSPTQIGVFLSHFSLWAHCLEIDRPIVILEHDAVMVQPYLYHKVYNNIVYLGSVEQKNGAPILPIPPHGSIYEGHWRFICRAHAYAIDPPMAKNLISYVLSEGITKTLDVIMRSDIFGIVQTGFFAYDQRGVSTIQEKEDYTEDC